MPFLPIVLFVAYQALSRSASFALGWATSLFFGHVPGNKGQILSIMGLISAAWLVVAVGFAAPLSAGWVAEQIGLVDRNFDLAWYQAWGLAAAVVLAPPVVAGLAELAGFDGDASATRWLSHIPVSYPAIASLGLAVLMMVLIAPLLVVSRIRQKKEMLPIPVVMRRGADDTSVTNAIVTALDEADVGRFERRTLTGLRSWPLRTMAFAAEHLLGSVVRGEPDRMVSDGMEVFSYATNVAILGPSEAAHRARAAIARQLAFSRAYLTWSGESQRLEDALVRLRRERDRGEDIAPHLDRFRARLDATTLSADEWNVLERLRLQLAQEVDIDAPAPGAQDGDARRNLEEVGISAR